MMRVFNRERVAIGLLACVTIVGCRTAAPGTAPSPASASARDAEVSSAAASNAAAIAQARADSLRYPYTAADIRFMSSMIGHHAQAIEMSRLAPTHGAGPGVLRLAERIINAQQDEITLMRQWLGDRQQPVPDIHPTAMMTHHAGHVMMPGMITPEQMKQLEEAKGTEFDRLFLTFMIQHHRGAMAMVKELFATPGAAQDLTVFKLARDVNVDQDTEVERMAQMLSALIFERRPP